MGEVTSIECVLCGTVLDAASDEWTLVCPQCHTARWNPRWDD